MFQHTAARRRLAVLSVLIQIRLCFNTQPPEGGCYDDLSVEQQRLFQHTAARRRLHAPARQLRHRRRFNTQPPEGGCAHSFAKSQPEVVSTHSRPKAAVWLRRLLPNLTPFQHTAARRRLLIRCTVDTGRSVSTHSRPKAAANARVSLPIPCRFQHTAARRRLR